VATDVVALFLYNQKLMSNTHLPSSRYGPICQNSKTAPQLEAMAVALMSNKIITSVLLRSANMAVASTKIASSLYIIYDKSTIKQQNNKHIGIILFSFSLILRLK
jgi:hypothetical protein